MQRNCWCLERQSPLGLAALSHHRDSQEIQLLQPSRTALLQPSRSSALTLWGLRNSGTLVQRDGAKPYLRCLVKGGCGSSCQGPSKATAQVRDGEAVSGPHVARVRDLGGLCLQHAVGENRETGWLGRSARATLGMPEQSGCEGSWPRLFCFLWDGSPGCKDQAGHRSHQRPQHMRYRGLGSLLSSPSQRTQRPQLPLVGKGHNPLCVKQGKEVRAIWHSLENSD